MLLLNFARRSSLIRSIPALTAFSDMHISSTIKKRVTHRRARNLKKKFNSIPMNTRCNSFWGSRTSTCAIFPPQKLLFFVQFGCDLRKRPSISTWARPTRQRIAPSQLSKSSRSTSTWWVNRKKISCARLAAHTTCLGKISVSLVAWRRPIKP